jgi:DNA replication and repair protein RecF
MFKSEGRDQQLIFGLKAGEKKILKLNGRTYKSLKDHVGRFPVIMVSPYDTDLIREGSELRRKFFDSMISQIDSQYLEILLQYHQILKQRNSLLKQIQSWNDDHYILLDRYDNILLEGGNFIMQTRSEALPVFLKYASKTYELISGEKEQIDIDYESEFLDQDYRNIFRNNRERDILTKRTGKGVHRDDFIFKMNDRAVKYFGSQGQQKTFAIALKLGMVGYLTLYKKTTPVVLLDDIFDRLDRNRIENLMRLLLKNEDQQIFITHTSNDQINQLMNSVGFSPQILQIEHGCIKA